MKGDRSLSRRPRMQILLLLCGCLTLFTAIVPLLRMGYRGEITYNEGWNVYNAQTVAQGRQLYPASFGWTMVNYPMLSFVIAAQLHRMTHDYLYSARAVSFASLLVSAVLIGSIAHTLNASKAASWLAGLFAIGVFCADASVYVGQDDPQLFAQVFYLAGLQVYLLGRKDLRLLAVAAFLVLIGTSIKHNLVDIPLAMLLDLFLLSRWRSLWLGACFLLFGLLDVELHFRYGGPAFLRELLAPRDYVFSKSLDQLLVVIGPVLIPFSLAIYTGLKIARRDDLRIALLLLGCALGIGAYFGGGQGVSINALFSALLAMCLLLGLTFDGLLALEGLTGAGVITALFASLLIPMIVSGTVNPVASIRAVRLNEEQFDQEVRLLRSQPGPALCESLLRCYAAGKPYVYDPFNATRLIAYGRLDAKPLVEAIQRRQYGSIQFDGALDREGISDRFAPEILATIRENYQPLLVRKDAVIYVPKLPQASGASESLR